MFRESAGLCIWQLHLRGMLKKRGGRGNWIPLQLDSVATWTLESRLPPRARRPKVPQDASSRDAPGALAGGGDLAAIRRGLNLE